MSFRKKEFCESCWKERIEPGIEGAYLGDYLGNKTDKIHVCENCYNTKEQEFLANYAYIYSYCSRRIEESGNDTGYIKADDAACYALKKDDVSKVLRQKNCSHCQPWKQKGSKKILAEQLKAKLNSLEYVAMPDLISNKDRFADMLVWFGKKGWISGTNINPGKGNEYKSEHVVGNEELEEDDFEEIANLVVKRRKEKEQLFEQKRSQILEKLNNQSNLYYFWGQTNRKERANSWVEWKGMRGYTTFSGKLNNGGYGLYIAENHPILDNFPFQTGFYLIDTDKPIERVPYEYWSDGGEDNPNNFKRLIEVGDQITITPYEIVDELIEKPQKNNPNVLLQSSSKLFNKKNTDNLLQYFKKNDIREVNLKDDGSLVITHNNNNNNEIVSLEQIENNSEIESIKNWLRITNQKSLSLQQLRNSSNSPASPPKIDYTPYLVGGGILFGLGLVMTINYLMGKKYRNK